MAWQSTAVDCCPSTISVVVPSYVASDEVEAYSPVRPRLRADGLYNAEHCGYERQCFPMRQLVDWADLAWPLRDARQRAGCRGT